MSSTGNRTVLVSGSLAFDLFYIYKGRINDHLIPGEGPSSINIRARGPQRFYGGCGGNAAYTLSLFGLKSKLFSWIGPDGAEYLRHLSGKGVDTSGVFVHTAPTPAAVLLEDGGGDQFMLFGEPEEPVTWDNPSFDDTGFAVVTSGLTAMLPAVFDELIGRGIPYIIDPGKMIADVSPRDLRRWTARASVVVLNQYESVLLARALDLETDGVRDLAPFVVVTEGERGLLLYHDRERPVRVAAPRMETVADPYGAGDAFLGGFAAAWRGQAGRPKGLGAGRMHAALQAARTGSVAAAFAVQSRGSQNHHFNEEQYMALYERSYGTAGESPFSQTPGSSVPETISQTDPSGGRS